MHGAKQHVGSNAGESNRAQDQSQEQQERFDRLEPEKRAVILMAYHFGMTREEIARRTGRPSQTVKTWIRRSLARMKEDLRE